MSVLGVGLHYRIVESAGVCTMCSEAVDQSEVQQSERSPFD